MPHPHHPRVRTHLATLSRDDADVGGDAVASFDLHQVAHHQLVGVDLQLVPFPDHRGLLEVTGEPRGPGGDPGIRVGTWRSGWGPGCPR